MRASFSCILALFTACSSTQFSGGNTPSRETDKVGGSNGSGDGVEGGNEMLLNLEFKSGDKQLQLQVKLQRKKGSSGEYVANPGAVSQNVIGDVPVDVSKIFSASKISARLTRSPEKENETQIEVLVSIAQFSAWEQSFSKTDLRLKAESSKTIWQKNEGSLHSYEKFGSLKNPVQTSCKIESNGKQPVPNSYSVVLTRPAPCDFKLPTVTIYSFREDGIRHVIPVGTYWGASFNGNLPASSRIQLAHNFPLSADEWSFRGVAIDNGFILVQPDGNSYLLVDAGYASRSHPSFKDAATIANDLSAQTFGRNTTLLKPNADTVFRSGSIIAIYDDTPDMGGTIEVNALIEASLGAGLTLSWKAQLR